MNSNKFLEIPSHMNSFINLHSDFQVISKFHWFFFFWNFMIWNILFLQREYYKNLCELSHKTKKSEILEIMQRFTAKCVLLQQYFHLNSTEQFMQVWIFLNDFDLIFNYFFLVLGSVNWCLLWKANERIITIDQYGPSGNYFFFCYLFVFEK